MQRRYFDNQILTYVRVTKCNNRLTGLELWEDVRHVCETDVLWENNFTTVGLWQRRSAANEFLKCSNEKGMANEV